MGMLIWQFFLNRFSSDSIKFASIPLTDTSFYMYILFLVLLMGIFHSFCQLLYFFFFKLHIEEIRHLFWELVFGDGILDGDEDDDEDGIANDEDDDDDSDGILDVHDDDDDGDGILDGDEDDDGDGIANDEDDGDDGDGILDVDEDDDEDGVQNDEDPDDDGDGIPDENDEL